MSYETISVRMNRSDPSIRWGFTLRQQGGKLLVASVDRDSLSDKAGMKPNDEVDAVCGRNASNMSINEANSIVDNSFREVNFNLRRYVTSHTCLPWTLTEQDNKLIVDDVRPGFGTGFGSAYGGTGNALSNHSTKQLDYRSSHDVSTNHHQSATNNYKSSSWDKTANERSLPIKYETGHHSDYSSANRTSHQGSYVVNNAQPRMYHSPSSYSRHEQSSYSKHTSSNGTQGNGHIPSYSTQTKTNLGVGNGSALGVSSGASAGGYRSGVTPTYNTNFGAQRHTAPSAVSPAAQSYSFNNGVTTSSYKASSGGTPLNQATFIQTSQLSPSLQPMSVSPGGTRIYYHSPSGRTRRELSPHASIQHLQYNSPMNLYSAESAAEQYSQQIGRPTELSTNYRTQSPAYLTSEAKKLIEEQEGRGVHRIASPSTQSSSFKRISQAVGEPVK
ncbi:hypothetical protein Q1695_011106 [Nippostrongylus brasiliensis]|nr:hypothetical protein Q1695_011106 [Nippostrongylus brasiliensis]